MEQLQRSAGFTLVEVLVVVVVVGVLATIAIPRYNHTRAGAFRSALISDLRNLSTAQEAHWRMEDGYADQLEALHLEASPGVTLTLTESARDGWAAQAVHRSLPSEECGVFYGAADPVNGAPASSPGQIGCTF